MENECSWYDPSCALSWLAEEIKAIFIWIYDGILSAIATLFESIPVPDFLANLQSYELPSSIAWAANALNLPFGLGIIVTAYTARFILRRLPFIG
jgi:hypothetical protein